MNIILLFFFLFYPELNKNAAKQHVLLMKLQYNEMKSQVKLVSKLNEQAPFGCY